MFSRIIIVGVGLLGGSVGLSVKRAHPSATVFGIGRSRSTLETAQRLSVIDHALTDITEIPQENDASTLVVACTPVGDIRETVHKALERFDETDDVLATDVGSTKASICRGIGDLRFIGSHPIAGSQRSGPEAARADLFQGRVTVLTPRPNHSREAVHRLRRFWESLGSTVVEMDAARHDEILAATSHLPHLISAALAATVTDEQRTLAGTGYADMTRLAQGPPDVWRDILSDNGENVLAAIRRFQARLTDLAEMLETNDIERLEAFLERAQ